MNSPFEELEYLADYLPEEGESVIVSRRSGELVCESFATDPVRDGLSDPEFYGRLVQANERLNAQAGLPMWCGVVCFFWLCVAIHKLAGIGWDGWFWDVGIGLFVALACFYWIRRRQAALFRREIRMMLNRQIRQRRLDRYTIIGTIRQHPELRTLLDEMSRWTD